MEYGGRGSNPQNLSGLNRAALPTCPPPQGTPPRQTHVPQGRVGAAFQLLSFGPETLRRRKAQQDEQQRRAGQMPGAERLDLGWDSGVHYGQNMIPESPAVKEKYTRLRDFVLSYVKRRAPPRRNRVIRWRAFTAGERLCPKLIAMQRAPADTAAESRYAAALSQPATVPMLAPTNSTAARVPAR